MANLPIQVDQELISLLLQGHLDGEIFAVMVAGGILAHPEAGPPTGGGVGQFWPTDPRTKAPRPVTITISPVLFTPTVAPGGGGPPTDGRLILRHLIAHAFLFEPELCYRFEELDNLLPHTQTDRPEVNAKTNATRPATLDDAEKLSLKRAIAPEENPNLASPFESPWVASLLDQLKTNPSDSTLRAQILEELLAERLTDFLSSNASLADFLWRRLEHTSAYRTAASQVGQAPDDLLDQAFGLEDLLLQAIEKKWAYPELVPKLQQWAVQVPSLNLFVRETIFLHKRFATALRGPGNLAIGKKDNPYRLQLLTKVKENKAGGPTPQTSFLLADGTWPIEAPLVRPEETLCGQTLVIPANQSFGTLLAQALSTFAMTLT